MINITLPISMSLTSWYTFTFSAIWLFPVCSFKGRSFFFRYTLISMSITRLWSRPSTSGPAIYSPVSGVTTRLALLHWRTSGMSWMPLTSMRGVTRTLISWGLPFSRTTTMRVSTMTRLFFLVIFSISFCKSCFQPLFFLCLFKKEGNLRDTSMIYLLHILLKL